MEIVSPTRGSRFPNARLGLVVTALIVAAVAFLGMRSVDWFLLKKSLRHRFAKVEWISASELADWLRANGRNRFLFTGPPLRLPGAVGSPATPVATV